MASGREADKSRMLDRLRAAPEKVATWAGSFADFARPLSQAELARADAIKTVVMPLGPYRNLTTMTGALFAFHPQAVVLNHAGDRLLGSRFDPLDDLGAARWRSFKAVSLRLLQGGRRSSFGGAVTHSHAFRGTPLAGLYAERFGDTLLKPGATAMLWKDSMRITNRFLDERPSVEALLGANPEALFLFPVRNPMDCARSNLSTGHWKHLVGKSEANFDAVLARILVVLRWFRERERAMPDRFMSYTEAELDAAFPARFAAFCRLPSSPTWLEDAPRSIEVAERAEHPKERRDLYARLVDETFAGDPDMRARLERFM
jgi:hypothetical protein